jgi:hypothetical protein
MLQCACVPVSMHLCESASVSLEQVAEDDVEVVGLDGAPENHN